MNDPGPEPRDAPESVPEPEGPPQSPSPPYYESQRHGFGLDEIEYEDEPPGSYLSRLRLGPGSLLWGVFLAGVTVELAFLAPGLRRLVAAETVLARLLPRARAEAEPVATLAGWVTPLDVVWRLLPLVAGAGLLLMLFVRLLQVTESDLQVRLANRAVALQFLALLAWSVARILGVGFLPALP